MSFSLLAAIAANVVECPSCGQAIRKMRDYQAEFVEIPQLGGRPLRELASDKVTLVCGECDWQKRTDNWREFLAAPT